MNEPNEELDKDSEFYIFDVFDRTKPKNKEAFYALKRYFDKHDEMTTECFREHESRIISLNKHVGHLIDTVEHLKTELESRIPKPLKIDTSKVPNEWEADQAFSKRWPWIRIDKKSSRVTCERCSKSEYHVDCFHRPTDNFQWFVNTHGACQVIHKQETT